MQNSKCPKRQWYHQRRQSDHLHACYAFSCGCYASVHKDGSSALVTVISLIGKKLTFFRYCFSVAFSNFDVDSLKARIVGSKIFSCSIIVSQYPGTCRSPISLSYGYYQYITKMHTYTCMCTHHV